MSVEAREWAKQVLRGRSDLPDRAKYLLQVLADMHNPKFGGCFPSNDSLGDLLGKARCTIQRTLHLLEAEGLLKRLVDEKRTILLPIDPGWGAATLQPGGHQIRSRGAATLRRGGIKIDGDNPVDIAEKGTKISDLAAVGDNRKGNRKGKLKGKKKGEVSFGALTPEETPRMKVEDVLASHSVCETPERAIKLFQTAIAGKGTANGGVVWKLWRDLVSVHHPKTFLKQPSNVQLAQLKSLYKHVGDELPFVLASVVSDWTWFVKYAKENAGAALWKEDKKAGYMIPNIAFVVKYLELAVNFHRFECHPTQDTHSTTASQPGLDTPLHTASQSSAVAHYETTSHTTTDTPVDEANLPVPATQEGPVSHPLEDAPEAAVSRDNLDTPSLEASHSASDTQSRNASHEAIDAPALVKHSPELADPRESLASRHNEDAQGSVVCQSCTETRNDEASPLARDAPNEKAFLQSVAKSAVKQVVEPKEKTLTNKLESGQIESDEARRRKEALEILKRY